ncbi:MAG: diadenylate cyclase CdaA [Clostridiales bacterium]|nr:diadenylate cyclase CdaA [Clostridiales bacterium]MCI7574283.1 diadenylate cyclase CdaA [Clostridiales bacterium]
MMEAIHNLMQQLTRMQWSDYLDIAVVAFLIYKLLPLVRAPGTMRIARAVIAVMVVAGLAAALRLYTLSFILNQFMAVGLLALVILFQPELRRMLDRLGSVKFRALFGYTKPTQDLETVIAQTVMACEIMSRERVGALIVFAREARLDDYFKTGTPIDGQVTEQLIRNIFFVKAPLHDGAMIIRDGRIAAAGCVLPLSDSSHLSADLGTRHRAGVGMSEVSDAVVVIVSEETGTISVAVGGMLKRHLAPQTLEKLLRNELCPKNDPDGEQVLALRLKKSLRNTDKEANTREK